MLDLGLLRHFITGFPSLCNSSLLFDIHVKKGNAFFGGNKGLVWRLSQTEELYEFTPSLIS